MIKSGKISKFLSNDQLQNLYTVFKTLPDQENTGPVYAYMNGITSQHYLYDYVNSQLCDSLSEVVGDKLSIDVALLLKEHRPWTIHCDYDRGGTNPCMAFLIPIDWNGPPGSSTHTVVFDQECTKEFGDFMNENHKLPSNALDLKDNLCSHVVPEHLEYVSLLASLKWEPGDLLYWNRKLLHCSDDFISQGITEKRAFVIFTSYQ
jgi:hypothetical protein